MADDTASRIAERAALHGLAVSPSLAATLAAYYDLLFRWNRTINLTALKDSDEAIDRLLLEPIAASTYLPRGARLMDIGSGGGSPAIPLALALPAASLVMVESKGRKAAFLREAVREVPLPEALVEERRFEELTGYKVDVVSLRAVDVGRGELSLLRNFLSSDGVLALFRSESLDAATVAAAGLATCGLHDLIGARSVLQLLKLSA